jgi:ribosome biogenesis SPOUT family RNA methylase Rps3
MRMLAGADAQIHFTHLSQASRDSLTSVFGAAPESRQLANASCHETGVLELMSATSLPKDKVCLLDPKAPLPLSPEDGDGRFEWFLFGVRVTSFSP